MGIVFSFSCKDAELLWRNRIALSAVDGKVGGSSPPRSEHILQLFFLERYCLEGLLYAVAAKPGLKGCKLVIFLQSSNSWHNNGHCFKF